MKRIEMQLFDDGKKIAMPDTPKMAPSPPIPSGSILSSPRSIVDFEIDANCEKMLPLTPGETTLVIATFSIRDSTHAPVPLSLPSSDDLTRDLGIGNFSPNASDKLWLNRININEDNDFYDLCTAASCLEQILSVTSIPMKLKPPHPTRSPSTISQPIPSLSSLGRPRLRLQILPKQLVKP